MLDIWFLYNVPPPMFFSHKTYFTRYMKKIHTVVALDLYRGVLNSCHVVCFLTFFIPVSRRPSHYACLCAVTEGWVTDPDSSIPDQDSDPTHQHHHRLFQQNSEGVFMAECTFTFPVVCLMCAAPWLWCNYISYVIVTFSWKDVISTGYMLDSKKKSLVLAFCCHLLC